MAIAGFISLIPQRAMEIWALMLTEPLVYFPLMGLWLIFEIFYIISNDENDVREVDVLDNGIESIYVAIMISPIISSGGQFNIADFMSPTPRTMLSIILFFYAVFLIISAFFKLLPRFVVHILGGGSIDTYLTFMALIYVTGSPPIGITTAMIVALPMLVTFIVKTIRRVTG